MEDQQLIKLLEELVQLPHETEWIEFKMNNKSPEEIGEYISALSNSACLHDKELGYLIFGVENNTHEIKGTSFKPKKEKIGNEELENWLATQLKPRIDFKIHEFFYKGLSVVILAVDPAVNTPVKFKGNAYIRVGSYKKVLLEHPEKERKIWNKVVLKCFEKELATEGMEDDDILKLIDYPSYFDLLELSLPSNKKAIIEKLEHEKILFKSSGKHYITNFGAILFAKNINSFENLLRKAVRVIIYKGNNRLKTEKEQVGVKGYAVGFEGLVDFINSQLPSNEEIGHAFRTEVKVYPEILIRELVANAIIHQDFSITGTGPLVEIFNDRIEITNPGKPLISTLRFIDHNPQSRNEKLAHFMRRINICEERGSGIDKVIHSCEVFQLPAPEFIEGNNFTRVIIFSPKSLRKMDKQDKIRATYQHCCLKYVSGNFMTNQSLRERFKVDDKNYPMVSRIINDTIQVQLIKDYDSNSKSRKYAKYIPFWA